MSAPVDHPPPLCPSCTARMKQAVAEGKVGIVVCGECAAREAARDAAAKATRLASLRAPAAPWFWDSNCGEWGLWDAAGNPLVMEYHFAEGNLDPYVEAMTAAAPEMAKLLDWFAEMGDWIQPAHPNLAKARALLKRLDEARRG